VNVSAVGCTITLSGGTYAGTTRTDFFVTPLDADVITMNRNRMRFGKLYAAEEAERKQFFDRAIVSQADAIRQAVEQATRKYTQLLDEYKVPHPEIEEVVSDDEKESEPDEAKDPEMDDEDPEDHPSVPRWARGKKCVCAGPDGPICTAWPHKPDTIGVHGDNADCGKPDCAECLECAEIDAFRAMKRYQQMKANTRKSAETSSDSSIVKIPPL